MREIIFFLLLYFLEPNLLKAQSDTCNSDDLVIDTITGLFLTNHTIPIVAKFSTCSQNELWVKLEFFKDSINGELLREYQTMLEFGGGKKMEVGEDMISFTEEFNGTGHYATYNTYTSYYKYFTEIDDWVYFGSFDESYVWNIEGLEDKNLSKGDLNMGLLGKNLYVDTVFKEILQKKYQELLNKNFDKYKIEYESCNFSALTYYDYFETLEYVNFVTCNNENFNKLIDIGKFLCEAHMYEEGILLFEVLNNLQESLSHQLLLNQLKGDAYWDWGKHEKALYYYKNYIELSDSLYVPDKNKVISGRKADTENILNQIDSCITKLNEFIEPGCIWSGETLVEVHGFDYCNFEINLSNLTTYNDLAFYLQQLGIHEAVQSIKMLNKIIEKFPNRTVAYINLGDAYYGLKETAKAKQAYSTYIEQMKANNKEARIPKRVWERVK